MSFPQQRYNAGQFFSPGGWHLDLAFSCASNSNVRNIQRVVALSLISGQVGAGLWETMETAPRSGGAFAPLLLALPTFQPQSLPTVQGDVGATEQKHICSLSLSVSSLKTL